MRRTILICLLLKVILSCNAKQVCNSCTNSSHVTLNNCSYNAVTAERLKQCSSVETLLVEFVVLPSFNLSGQLKEIRVQNCKTTSVVIDPVESYNILSLEVEKNELRALPRNLNVLKKLRKLNLASNLIECIDMAEFIGLFNLEEINLENNRIIQICSSPFDPPVLPKLTNVYLQRNMLTTLNLENWKTPNVKIMYLHSNQLSVVNKLADSLPSLKSLYIYENPLNCEWWTSTKNDIGKRCEFSPEKNENCSQNAKPLDKLMQEIEASSKIPSTSIDQCQVKSSQSLEQILAQVQQLQQLATSFGRSKPKTNETISQLQQTCLGQQKRLRDLVSEVDSLTRHQRAARTSQKPARKDCRCGLKAQARLFQRQLGRLEQEMAAFGLQVQGQV